MGMTKFYIYLTDEEKEYLNQIIATHSDDTAMRARILLASDFNNPVYRPVVQMAKELGVSKTTIQNVRNRYGADGLEGAVFSKGNYAPAHRAYISDDKRKQILDMIKEAPPYGHRRWTGDVITEECMKRGIFEYIARSAIYKFLKEENITL